MIVPLCLCMIKLFVFMNLYTVNVIFSGLLKVNIYNTVVVFQLKNIAELI